jgi:ribonucleoside-diphosphate reductase alpha chain
VRKKINRPVPDLPIADDTELLEHHDNNSGNGKGHSPEKQAPLERTVKSLNDSIGHFQQDAPMCPNCGHVAVRNGACYKCLNCGESLGCS